MGNAITRAVANEPSYEDIDRYFNFISAVADDVFPTPQMKSVETANRSRKIVERSKCCLNL
jgi:hypothetical protein